ncbi:spore germination protein KA [Evansella caseinilytica]|uniref:Spore germination protein KA n=1 Tax=Evansella caseinilytica TaxID=1503961 RepID=A0A1H3UML0_9BACI|nr:spore germination protein [Evansella caseinilytica]SDZ63644.1 spore germination protein KA [Evansella caseinilytica]
MKKKKTRKTTSRFSLFNRSKNRSADFAEEMSTQIEQAIDSTDGIDSRVQKNIDRLKDIMGNSHDFIVREVIIRTEPFIQAAAMYIDGLADHTLISDFIIKAILEENHPTGDVEPAALLTTIKKQMLTIANVTMEDDWKTIVHSLLSGNTILFVDGIPKAFVGETAGGEWRSIEEPTSEITIRGAKDSFNESLLTNISLIRRRIKSPQVRIDLFQLGTLSRTDTVIFYIDGITDRRIVQEVEQRMKQIKADKITGSSYVEEWIQDQTLTVFPTVFNTERPDIVVNCLMEGRVAILVDGSPFALIVPTDFSQFFKAAEDYYQRFDLSTLIRVLRYFAFSVSLLGPSIYIALITFHQDLIPTTLVISLAAQREGIPFPAFIEALIMEVTFEVLREAGVRMPRAIGQAVSIVGALVIGQAAVQAGIVSAAMVIVVAGTAIASFTTPAYNLAVAARILRFAMMFLAATMGLYGILLGLIIMIAHLTSLKSFGSPYLSPFAPFYPKEHADGLFRFPQWLRRKSEGKTFSQTERG